MSGWTKRQFIMAAFEEIGIASYEFDLEPEQMQGALRRIDSMLAMWNGRGIRVGYPLPGNPDESTLDQETNVPDRFNEPIISNLAIRLAPAYGKTINPATASIARESYDALMARAAMPGQMQLQAGTPAGAGAKSDSSWDEWSAPPSDNISAGPDSDLEL